MRYYPTFNNWLTGEPMDQPSGNVKKGNKVRYSHPRSYTGRGNDTARVNFPDDDEGGDWSESDVAEAGMGYRKPL